MIEPEDTRWPGAWEREHDPQRAQETLQRAAEWLDSMGKSRRWLANLLGVSVGAVNGWYSPASGRPIPTPTARLLELLIRSTEPVEPNYGYLENQLIRQAMKQANCDSYPAFVQDAVGAHTMRILAESANNESTNPLASPPSDPTLDLIAKYQALFTEVTESNIWDGGGRSFARELDWLTHEQESLEDKRRWFAHKRSRYVHERECIDDELESFERKREIFERETFERIRERFAQELERRDRERNERPYLSEQPMRIVEGPDGSSTSERS